MMYDDLVNGIEVRRGISPAAAVTNNTPFVSEIIDTAGFQALTWLILSGDLADADVTTTVLVEDGDAANLSDAAAVPDEQLIGTNAAGAGPEVAAAFAFADDNEVHKIGYKPRKRYCRLTVTPANNTGNIFLAAVAVLSGGRHKPSQYADGAAFTQVP